MKNSISVMFLYNVSQRTFNIGENGDSKCAYDPITGKRYLYGSSANIKHNFADDCYNYLNKEKPVRFFTKGLKDKENQGGVSTYIDIHNNLLTVTGAWNSEGSKNSESIKYKKCAFKASIEFGNLEPLHTSLATITKDCGVNVGDENSKIRFKEGKDNNVKFYNSPEELAGKNMSYEEAKNKFANTRAMNFYHLKERASGIYFYCATIRIDKVGKWKKSQIEDDEMINEFIENGFKIEKINGEEYFVPSKDIILNTIRAVVESLFSWEFSSNNSLNGSPLELLRVSFALNNIGLLQNCTYGEPNKIVLHDDVKEVHSYNTLLLRKVYDADSNNIKTDMYSEKKAKEDLLEMCENFVDESYPKD